jgi:gliding motility-associated-like protein
MKNIISKSLSKRWSLFSLGIVFCSAFTVKAQSLTPLNLPSPCVSPPAGYVVDGNFQFGQYQCINIGVSTTTFPITSLAPALTNIKFGIVSTDNVDILSSSYVSESPTLVAGEYVLQKSLSKGHYYVIQTGTKANGQKVVKCQPLEVISREKPTITASVCTPNEVTLTIPQATENNHSQYKLDWGGGVSQILNITSTTTFPIEIKKSYTGSVVPSISAAGKYIRGGNEVCVPSSSYTVTVSNGTPTILTELTGENEGTGATFKFIQFTPGNEYELLATEDLPVPGTPVSVGTGKNGIATATGLDASKKYCFQIASKNACGVYTKSNTLCNIKLTTTLKSTSSVKLDWNIPTEPITAPNRLIYERNTIGCSTCFHSEPFSSTTTKSFEDNGLECVKKYQYRIISRHSEVIGGIARIIFVRSAIMTFDPKASATAYTPDDLVVLGYSPTDENLVRMDVITSAIDRDYEIFRSEKINGDYTSIGKTSVASFEDVSIDPNKTAYCYKYKYKDACDIETNLSNPFCTILLESKNPGTLNWSSFTLPSVILVNSTSVEYSIEYFNSITGAYVPLGGTVTNSGSLFQNVQSLLSDLNESEFKFRVIAKQFVDTRNLIGQFVSSYSNTYTIKIPPSVFVPTVFTPNGDGNNDIFLPTTKLVIEGDLLIYDRWGGILFEIPDLLNSPGWNGLESDNITKAPMGNYPYKIKGVSTSGEKFEKYGSILLVR